MSQIVNGGAKPTIAKAPFPFRRALLAEDFLPSSIEYRTDDKEWRRNDFPRDIDAT